MPAHAHHAGVELETLNETQPLLSGSGTSTSSQQPQPQARSQPCSPTKAASSTTNKPEQQSNKEPARAKSQELGQCRICLEEDVLPNLQVPCACTGTQRYAHQDCIQKWVNEKHHTTCEICDQPYKGSYNVPPPPPPNPGEPLTLVSRIGNVYVTVDDERLAEQLRNWDVYDEQFDDHRQPTVSWCFSFMMFLLFMMFLQSAMPDAGSTTPGSPPGVPSPAVDPALPPAAAGAPDASGAAGSAFLGLMTALSLLLMWVMSKLILAMFPLLMVMRLAARAQEQADAEAAAASSGTVPGLDSPDSRAGEDREHPVAALLARLAAARAARVAGRSGSSNESAASAGPGSSSGSPSMADLEMEVMQARREAISRLGRDATFFWGGPPPAAAAAAAAAAASTAAAPAAAAGGAAAGDGASSSRQQAEAGGEQPQPQQEEEGTSGNRLMSLRALIHAMIARRQGYEQPGSQSRVDETGNGSSRVSGGVV